MDCGEIKTICSEYRHVRYWKFISEHNHVMVIVNSIQCGLHNFEHECLYNLHGTLLCKV